MTNSIKKNTRAPEKIWLLTFALSALIYLVSLNSSPYFGQFAIKAFPILVLVFASFYQLKENLQKLMATALICSAIGDVFLAPSAAYNFIAGLGAFLIAQLIYCRVFYDFKTPVPSVIQRAQAVILVVYAVVMAVVILPATGELMLPVVVYLSVISSKHIAQPWPFC